MNDPMKQQIRRWIESEEFKRFIKSGLEAFNITKQEKNQDDLLLREKLIETGRFYNHLMITMSREFLDQIKKTKDFIKKEIDNDSIIKALSLYITEFEEEVLNQFGALFQFFTAYRDKTKRSSGFLEDIEEEDFS